MKWTVGYRAMCRFRAGPIFHQPVLANVDFAMTLDTDGYLPDYMEADPIKELYERKASYSWSHLLMDQPGAVRQFWQWT